MAEKKNEKDKIQPSVNEPEAVYAKKKPISEIASDEYVTLEEFRVEAKKQARKLLNEHGIHS